MRPEARVELKLQRDPTRPRPLQHILLQSPASGDRSGCTKLKDDGRLGRRPVGRGMRPWTQS